MITSLIPSFCFTFLQADDNEAIHVISVADPPTVEKPPEYDTVVILDPPCYDDAIKLNPANLLQTKHYQDMSLPNYADLDITGSINSNSSTSTPVTSNNSHQDLDNSQLNGVITTRNGTNNHNNSVSQTNSQVENVSNSSSNSSTVITIEQTASDEHSITHKSADCDSVASESSVLS